MFVCFYFHFCWICYTYWSSRTQSGRVRVVRAKRNEINLNSDSPIDSHPSRFRSHPSVKRRCFWFMLSRTRFFIIIIIIIFTDKHLLFGAFFPVDFKQLHRLAIGQFTKRKHILVFDWMYGWIQCLGPLSAGLDCCSVFKMYFDIPVPVILAFWCLLCQFPRGLFLI